MPTHGRLTAAEVAGRAGQGTVFRDGNKTLQMSPIESFSHGLTIFEYSFTKIPQYTCNFK